MLIETAAKPLVWITGAGGFIGSHLMASAPQFAPGWRVRALGRPQVDLLDFTSLEAAFRQEFPQLIIHCAAISTVADAKADPALARRVNVELTRFLAGLAADCGFVLFSTDLVFDGRQGQYRETDAPNPLHQYGETKAAAEQVVLTNPRHLIVRTSINGGVSRTGNRGFNEQLRQALQMGRGMTLFTDEYRSPIPVMVTIRVLWELLHRQCAGLFHVGGAEKMSRWQIGQSLIRRWPELADRIHEIKPGLAKDFPGPPRALDTSMDISKVQGVVAEPVPGLSAWLEAHPHEPF